MDQIGRKWGWKYVSSQEQIERKRIARGGRRGHIG
jgi:hypothetical protein